MKEFGVKVFGGFCTLQEFERLIPLKGKNYCTGGITRCYINAKGEVYPCPAAESYFFRAGNVKDVSLKDIWDKSAIFQLFRYYYESPPTLCTSCEKFLKCEGGCRIQVFYQKGYIVSNSPPCHKLNEKNQDKET